LAGGVVTNGAELADWRGALPGSGVAVIAGELNRRASVGVGNDGHRSQQGVDLISAVVVDIALGLEGDLPQLAAVEIVTDDLFLGQTPHSGPFLFQPVVSVNDVVCK